MECQESLSLSCPAEPQTSLSRVDAGLCFLPSWSRSVSYLRHVDPPVGVRLEEATLTSESDGSALETQPSPYSLLFHLRKVITSL